VPLDCLGRVGAPERGDGDRRHRSRILARRHGLFGARTPLANDAGIEVMRACRGAYSTAEDAQTVDGGGIRPAALHPADILGRTPRLAATLKEGAAAEDDTWRDFALVALDLAGQRPLDEIPRADRSSDGGSLRGTEESRRVTAAGRKAMCGGSMSDTREVSATRNSRAYRL
jgi:hypothetical protein